MEEIQWQIFAYIVTKVETPLVSAVAQVTNNFLSWIAAPLKVTLVLYIALTGIAIVAGKADQTGAVLLQRFLKLGVIVWVLTGSGVYQQYVYDFFFTTLPQELANTLTSSGAGGSVSPSSFDVVWVKAWHSGLEVWRSLGWQDIPEKFVVVLFWMVSIVSTVFAFAIWLISRVLLALYIAVGPLLIALALFPATRSIFERWIGSLISCVILQITTTVLLFIVLSVEREVVAEVVLMGSTDPMAMIQVLLAGVIFFAVAAFVALHLPAVASSLAGGLHFHTGSLARAAQAAIGSAGHSRVDAQGNKSRVGRSGVIGASQYAASAAAGGAMSGGRAIYQRIRPPAGGSLSDRGPSA